LNSDKQYDHLRDLDEHGLLKLAAITAKNSFRAIDSDSDGTISLKEFTEYVMNGEGDPQAVKNHKEW
jgi:hypothetical protein